MTAQPAPALGFATGIRTFTECGERLAEVLLQIAPRVMLKKDAMMDAFPNREWIAYLQGATIPNGYTITDIVVPEQETTSASCNITDAAPRPENCIGTIHSHHNLGAFFSQTDMDSLIKNYLVNIVVTHTEMKALTKVKAKCGHYYAAEPKIVILYPDKPVTDWVKAALPQIKAPPPAPIVAHPWKRSQNNAIVRECMYCGKVKSTDVMDFQTVPKTGELQWFCYECAGYNL